MPSFPAVDVALGLILVYFLMSLVVSAANEFIAARLNWRARDLERAIVQLLGKQEGPLRQHPLIRTLVDPKRRDRARKLAKKKLDKLRLADPAPAQGAANNPDEAKAQARIEVLRNEGVQLRVNEYPSYIPARTFVAALLDQTNLSTLDLAKDANEVKKEAREAIEALPQSEARDALLAIFDHAAGDLNEFRRNAERWYDDAMERVSGWYRRRVQWVILVLSAALAIAINADTLQLAKYLWTNPAAQQAVANAAQRTAETSTGSVENAREQLEALPLPLGWRLERGPEPQAIPIYKDWDMVWSILSKLLGLGLTTGALMLGAPFWFDTLSKIARLRNSGAPPPASDAVRRGEGEETRAGTPATFVIQATAEQSTGTAQAGAQERKGNGDGG